MGKTEILQQWLDKGKDDLRAAEYLSTIEFPVIGHGNVLRDNIKTTEEINKDIDKILKHSTNEALFSTGKLFKNIFLLLRN